MMRARRSIPVMVALALVAGCSSTTEGDASPDPATSTTVAGPPAPWDPCTIPDDAIERAGLNVDTKESGVFGRDQFGFKICGWENRTRANKYYVRIFVGFQTIDWISDTGRFDGLSPVLLGTREATQFRQVSASEEARCGVAYTVGSELIMATIISDVLVETPQYDPCTELNMLIQTLGSELPS